jgi:hypothetical protein
MVSVTDPPAASVALVRSDTSALAGGHGDARNLHWLRENWTEG